ncbi:hypothetical protein [Sphingomonas koreensis]
MTAFSLRATTALIPLMLMAAPAAAQNSTAPTVITPPVRNFDLPPSGQTPTPRPTPAPAPAPVLTVQPIPIPTPTPAATRAATQRPVRAPAAASSPAATGVPPAAEATPLPDASPLPLPSGVPAQPQTVPDAVQAAPAAGGERPAWLWPALGGAVLLVVGAAAFALLRRRRRDEEIGEAAPPEELAVSPPTPGPPPLAHKTLPAAPARPAAPATPTAPAAPALPPVPPPDGPLVTEIRPMRAAIVDGMVTLDLELFIQNRGAEPADNVRASLALLGANAEQDVQIANFHGAARLAAGSEPFSIAPGTVQVVNAQVSLPGDQMKVVTVQGKPMFVPIVPVSLKWYAGLSIRTLRDAFMVGIAPAAGSDRLGPLWVERAGEGFGRLAAKRYVPKA